MRAACVLLAAALLAACATPRPPVQSGEAPWTSGRISVRVDATPTQTAQGLSAAFELRGNGDSGELRLMSPLGSRVAAARWAPGLAVLDTPQGEQRYDTLDELSRRTLGGPLPLAALPDWLQGRPWPAAVHAVNNNGFEQLGWQVVLDRRAEGMIEARRLAPPGVTLRVRLDTPEP
jgi:outer membrane lipoprotein LolB